MNSLDLLFLLKKENSIENILFFNDLNLSKNDLIELSKFVKNIYVSYYNSFVVRNLSVQLRYIKNIHIFDVVNIPSINYDMLFSYDLNDTVFLITSKVKSLKFIYFTKENAIFDSHINGFKLYQKYQNLYVKDYQNVIVDENSLNNLSIKNEIILLNNSKKQESKENKFIPAKQNKNNGIINIKNVVATKNSFNYFNNEFINYGLFEILCILENKKDYDLFENVLTYINNNYQYVKYIIILKGQTILKYFNESKLKSINHILIKINKDEISFNYDKLFDILTTGSYKINYKDINLNENILDLL